MADNTPSRSEETREVLINALEVQLAAMTAAVGFWREWMERTSEFVKTTSKSLNAIRETDKDANQVLLEIVDASREGMRVMTELPRNAAERFIRELDQIEQKKKSAAKAPAAKKAGTAGTAKTAAKAPAASKAKAPNAPKRRARAKP